MDKSIGKLTVYFDDPFWVGVFEHIEDENYLYARLHLEQNQKIMKYWNLF